MSGTAWIGFAAERRKQTRSSPCRTPSLAATWTRWTDSTTFPRRTTTLSGPTRGAYVPELPEVEAWRRQLDANVKRFPIEQAGPAHIATLKTFDPPLAALAGEGLEGARRRAKRFLFPTDDGELVLYVHLMSAGRLKYLHAGEKGPKTPMFRLRFTDGGELVLTEAGA